MIRVLYFKQSLFQIKVNVDCFISRLYLGIFGEGVHNGSIGKPCVCERKTTLYFKSSIPDCFLVCSLLVVFSRTTRYNIPNVHSG